MPDVRIVDLEIIKRFSLAVRQEYADAGEVIEALEASLAEARAAGGRKRRSGARKTTRRKSSARSRAGSAKRSPSKQPSKRSSGSRRNARSTS